MNIEPNVPDVAPQASGATPYSTPISPDGGADAQNPDLVDQFSQAVGAVSEQMAKAQQAQEKFIAGHGSVQEMAVERARADALLEEASAASSRASQQLSSILNMQV